MGREKGGGVVVKERLRKKKPIRRGIILYSSKSGK